MNKNNKAKRCGVVSRSVGNARLVTGRSVNVFRAVASRNISVPRNVIVKKTAKQAQSDEESARQFVTDFYKKHGKAMSQLANE